MRRKLLVMRADDTIALSFRTTPVGIATRPVAAGIHHGLVRPVCITRTVRGPGDRIRATKPDKISLFSTSGSA